MSVVRPLPLPPETKARSDGPGWRQRLRDVVREPLVHFMLIGVALLGLSSLVTPASERERTITVSPAVRDEMAALFRTRFNRPPSEAELKPMIDQWIRNEVLYREAIALGLDKGDQGLRDRIVQKMNLLVFQQAKPPLPTDAQLQAWFEAHRAQFDEPATVDFIAVAFDGDGAEAKAREALARIAQGAEAEDVRARARVYRHWDQAKVDPAFGPGFLAALRAAPAETWSVAPGRDGWFIVRVDGLHEAKPATLEKFYDASVSGWQYDAAHALAAKALGQLERHYIIRGASFPE